MMGSPGQGDNVCWGQLRGKGLHGADLGVSPGWAPGPIAWLVLAPTGPVFTRGQRTNMPHGPGE